MATMSSGRWLGLPVPAALMLVGLLATGACTGQTGTETAAPPAAPAAPVAPAAPAGSEYLTGAIDFHTHPAPDVQPRETDASDLAKLVKARGMRGVVLKNHHTSTAGEAALIRKDVPGVEVFGGITLNLAAGGINPSAVEAMAHTTGGWGKVVWFPTQDADYRHAGRGKSRGSTFALVPLWQVHRDPADVTDPPFVAVARNGQLLPETKAVIAVIARHDLVLETGHSSPEEALLMVAEGKKQGVKHMLLTHAASQGMTAAQMQEAAKNGAYIEWIYTHILDDASIGRRPLMPTPQYVALLRSVGVDSAVMASEGGSSGNPLPPDGLAAFAAALAKEGFTPAELAKMMKENPAKLLGLSPL
jgi:hypothetical protein